MLKGYAKMRLLDAFIGRILDIHQMHWTQTHLTHVRIAPLPRANVSWNVCCQ